MYDMGTSGGSGKASGRGGNEVMLDIAFKSLNYMIQGSASGVMKRAIVNVSKELRFWPGCSLLLTIHDELCIEVPNSLHSKKLLLYRLDYKILRLQPCNRSRLGIYSIFSISHYQYNYYRARKCQWVRQWT